MVCLGFEPGAAGWKARTNTLSYGGTPQIDLSSKDLIGEIFDVFTLVNRFLIMSQVHNSFHKLGRCHKQIVSMALC